MIVGLVAWIARALVVFFLIRMVLRLFSSGSRRPAPRPASPTEGSERTGGTLVRDPQCGTYVSKTRSFQVGRGAGAQYFCSLDCRDKHAATHARP